MATIGEQLYEARERQGLTLQQVEAQLHIRQVLLAAMEEDRFEELPGGPYTRGLVRTYARFLGLPAEELLAQFASQPGLQASSTPIPSIIDEPLIIGPARRSVWPTVFLVLMALLVAAVGGWYLYARYHLQSDPLSLLKQYGILPESFLGEGATPLTTTAPAGELETPPSAPGGGPVASPSASSPSARPTSTLEAVPTPTPRRTATPTLTPTPGPQLSAEPIISGQVVVQASVVADTWVSVTADGAEIFSGTLHPGEQHTWQANEVLSLVVGNAGGIELTVNGQPIGFLGASGEVVTREFRAE